MVEQMLVDKVLNGKAPATEEKKVRFALVIFSGTLSLIGICLMLYALYLWLSSTYSEIVTMATLGAVTLALSALLGLSLQLIAVYKRRKIAKMKSEFIQLAETTLGIFEHELSKPVNDNPKIAVLVSSIAGYLAGENFL